MASGREARRSNFPIASGYLERCRNAASGWEVAARKFGVRQLAAKASDSDGLVLRETPDVSSEALARQAREGSRACFDRLVQRHADSLLRFLTIRSQSVEDAEELAQETFLKAWRHLGDYDSRRSFRAWLFTIAARLTISHLRRHRAGTLEEEQRARLASSASGPEEQAMTREGRDNLWALAREILVADQVSALWLHYVEGLPTAQVARILGKKESSARVLLHRARERLKSELDSREERPSGYLPTLELRP